jgi:hypothetical protein
MIEIVIVLAHTDPARVRFAHSPVRSWWPASASSTTPAANRCTAGG